MAGKQAKKEKREPNRRRLTASVEKMKLKPKGQRETIWDTLLPGFGVRIGETRKSWICFYRVNGKGVFETIAPLTLMSLEEAREEARDRLRQAHKGINPRDEKRQRKAQAKRDEQAAQERTVAKIVDRYLRERVSRRQKPSTAAMTIARFNKYILPNWGERSVTAITSADVKVRIAGIHTHAPITANRVLSQVKAFFNWCMAQELIATNPAAKVEAMEDEKARDRFLSDSEIVAFWKACEQAGYPSGPLGKLLLLSGQRRNELGHMEWSELDFSKRTWTIPKERAKNKERHIVHLSDRAVEILNSLPRNGSPFVFLGRNGNKLSGWSGTKDAIDKHMGEVERWTFHDLRRTAATVMAEELKIAPHVVDAILNHTSVIKGVAAIYNRARYLKERAAALDAWASYIDALVNPQPSNVVQMAAAR